MDFCRFCVFTEGCAKERQRLLVSALPGPNHTHAEERVEVPGVDVQHLAQQGFRLGEPSLPVQRLGVPNALRQIRFGHIQSLALLNSS